MKLLICRLRHIGYTIFVDVRSETISYNVFKYFVEEIGL